MTDPTGLGLRLNGNAVKRPLLATLQQVCDNVALGMVSLESFNPAERPRLPTDSVPFGFHEPQLTMAPEEIAGLKEQYSTWLLLAAFSAFIKGVSASLQEAAVYCAVVSHAASGAVTLRSLKDTVFAVRTRANKLPLPTLFDEVEARLTSALEIRAYALSFNAVRNCLEHRGGIVTERDLGPTGAMVMLWRQMKVFVVQDGEEVEVRPPMTVSSDIMIRIAERSKSFVLGERVVLTVEEFNEAMFTCVLLAWELAEKLPPLASNS